MTQKNLILILARGLADEIASGMFVVDAEGTLVYYNEAAGDLLGRSFAELGEVKMEIWATAFNPCDLDGRPLPTEEVPLVKTVLQRAPVHRKVRITAADDEVRDLAVTAFPLFARREEFVGAVAIFWEHMGDLENGE